MQSLSTETSLIATSTAVEASSEAQMMDIPYDLDIEVSWHNQFDLQLQIIITDSKKQMNHIAMTCVGCSDNLLSGCNLRHIK